MPGVVIHLPNLRQRLVDLARSCTANDAIASEMATLAFDLVRQHLDEQGYTITEKPR